MKRILLALAIIFSLSSCVTTSTIDTSYEPYDVENNVIVNDDICYVYYTNPSTLFLNTLYIVDGSYYYWHVDKYIPVVFPRWEAWSPHRYFYYDKNRWAWRDRYHYDHNRYRREHHWIDYRKPSHRMFPNKPRQHPNTINNNNNNNRRSTTIFGTHNRRQTVNNSRFRPTRPNRSFGNRTRRPTMNSSSRINSGGHFGGRR